MFQNLVQNFINTLLKNPDYDEITDKLQNDFDYLVNEFKKINAKENIDNDYVRKYLIEYTSLKADISINIENFVFGSHETTVGIILEDAYGGISEDDDILFPNQTEAIMIIKKCYFNSYKINELENFLNNLLYKKVNSNHSTRFKAIFWLTYLAFELFEKDWLNACTKGFDYIDNKIKELLDHAINGTLVSQNDEFDISDYEKGIWSDGLFSYLQAEISVKKEEKEISNRKKFVKNLKQYLNFDNKSSIRYLTPKNRECIYQKVYEIIST